MTVKQARLRDKTRLAIGSICGMASSDRSVGWLRTNQGVAACLVVAMLGLLGYLLSQDWVYQQQRDGFRLGFFTMVSALVMLVCVGFTLIGKQKDQTTPEMARMRGKDWLRGIAALLIMLVYYVLAWDAHFSQDWVRAILNVIPFTGDFLIWTVVFLTMGMAVLGVRPITSAITAGVIVSFVIFGLFLLIGIDLPQSVIGQLLGTSAV